MANYGTGGSDHYYFLDAVATVHVLTANNIDVKLEEIRFVHFPWLSIRRLVLREKTNSTVITCIGKFYHLLTPELPRDIAFIPSVQKRVQRWRISWIKSILTLSLSTFFKHNKMLIIHNAVDFIFKNWSYRTGHKKSTLYTPLPRLNLNFLSALPR